MDAYSRFFRVIGLTFSILILCCPATSAQQEKISPISDYQYKKDYAEFENIKKEADPQKRADLLVAFVKQHPISRILYYAATEYLECIKPHLQKKDWSKAVSMEEAFLALVPTEKAVRAAQLPVGTDEFVKEQLVPTHKALLAALMQAHYQSGNMAKAAEFGEKVYAIAPDKAMVATLGDLYLRAKNYDRYLVYGEKVMIEFPMDQSYGHALQMAQIHLQKQNVNKAKELYFKVVDAYGNKIPPGMQEPAWNSVRSIAYSLTAAEAYAQKDYPKAIELYQQVARFDPKRDDAYYYIGMSKWNNKDQEGAIEAFAKTVVLGKENAAKARQYMEDLYKAVHNNSLDGLEEVISKAKADLGIS